MAEYITDDIFGVEVRMMEEIHIDQTEETKQYILSLSERISRMRDQSEVEGEAIASSSRSNAYVSCVLSDDSARYYEADCIKVEDFISIDQNGKRTVISNFRKSKQMEQWRETLAHHTNRLRDTILNLEHCSNHVHDVREIVKRLIKWNEIQMPDV